ncbi:hypothetical protein COY07_05700 [Candidatus Peregrinibacteria bacterium CG_4_10_14_0_2_um_filter_43_11]|nr:MAG: hypothetical protein COY07_05700 [Candidatus Peregrinibacteria bacterium CG_4_10_14_0_2_um_filter_43_11]
MSESPEIQGLERLSLEDLDDLNHDLSRLEHATDSQAAVEIAEQYRQSYAEILPGMDYRLDNLTGRPVITLDSKPLSAARVKRAIKDRGETPFEYVKDLSTLSDDALSKLNRALAQLHYSRGDSAFEFAMGLKATYGREWPGLDYRWNPVTEQAYVVDDSGILTSELIRSIGRRRDLELPAWVRQQPDHQDDDSDDPEQREVA